MTPWEVSVAGTAQHTANSDAGVVASQSPQTFSFTLEDDLVKLVTVAMVGLVCHVTVRYARDVVLHEENHAFEVASPIEIETTRQGVTIRAKRPGIAWLHRKLVRKF